MAQPRISKLANLFLMINNNLIEDDVRNLRSLLAIEEVLGKARVEHATPLEILNMLVDNATIGEGNLGFLVEVLKSLRKEELAKKAEGLEKEYKLEGRSDVRRRPTPTLKRQQGNLKKRPESGDKTDHKNGGYSNTTLKLAFCFLLLLLLLALVWRLKTSKESALQRCLKDLRIQEAKGDKAGQIDANIRVAQRYRYLCNTDQAITHFDTALKMAQQTEDLHKQMHIYFWVGEMHREQLLSPRKGIQQYEQQLALARQLGDRYEEEMAQHRLGLAHEEMREYEAALRWHEKMYMKMRSVIHMGKSRREVRDNAPTRKNLWTMDTKNVDNTDMENLDQAQQTGDPYDEMEIYFKMAKLQRIQHNSPRTCIQYYEQHLLLAKLSGGDRLQEEWAYSRLGHAHYEMGEYETALKWHQKYLKMVKESNDKTKQLTGGKNMAASYQALGKLDQARYHYQSAISIAMETGNKQQQKDIAERLDDLSKYPVDNVVFSTDESRNR